MAENHTAPIARKKTKLTTQGTSLAMIAGNP
jgi:hypothetical protein